MKAPFTETHPKVAAEWHPTKNGNLRADSITAGVARKCWWLGDCGHEWDALVNVRTGQNQGCPFCAGKRILQGFNDLETTNPSIAAQWHPSKNDDFLPNEITAGSNKRAWWLGGCGHSWESNINDRVSKKTKCPVCVGRLVVPGVNDLETTHYILSTYWDHDKNHDLKPNAVVAGSRRKVYWVCPLGHQFSRTVVEQALKTSGYCSDCSPKKIYSGVNDFETRHPLMARQWHPTKNLPIFPNEISPASHENVWWLGECGHEFIASIRNRANKNTGCPVCLNQQVLIGFNDLETVNPALAAEWHPTLNGKLTPKEITAGSNKRVWWQCQKGHSWQVPIAGRHSRGYGCSDCNASIYISKAEQEIANFIQDEGFLVVQSDRELLKGSGIGSKEIDILIPEKKIAIEFNCLFWHSEKLGKHKTYHYDKWNVLAEKGYQLIQIWEDEWKKSPDLVKKMILHKLGISREPQIYARKTNVVKLTTQNARDFFNKYHIQGFASGSYYYGLEDKGGSVVAFIILKQEEGGVLNIIRYATSAKVVGGFTKLLSYVEKNIPVLSFVTFSDNCVSDGRTYLNSGFVADKILAPDYKYIVNNKRCHKYGFRLKRFRNDPDLLWQDGLTESQLAELNDIPRIWDAGKIRWKKVVNEQSQHLSVSC